MFKLAYNANGLRNMNVIDAIKKVSTYQYDGIELSLHKSHLDPFNVTIDELKAIKVALQEYNLLASDIATGAADLLSDDEYEPSLINSNQEGRKKRIECIKKSIAIAEYLGINIVNISSGFKKEDISDEEAMEYLIVGIKECLQASNDIILAIEPEPGMFIGTTDSAIELIKRIGSDRLRLNLDIGHVVCCEEDYLQKIKSAIKYTVHIHIEDIKNRVHYHLIPGEGDIDLSSVLSLLKEEDYNGFVSVELYHHADVCDKALQNSYMFLKSLMDN